MRICLRKSKRIATSIAKIFEEAINGYGKRMTELLEEHLERLKKGKRERVTIMLPYPEDHTTDYDRVIAMLEMHQQDTIEIPEHYFSQYVMDEWGWQKGFLETSSNYSAMARGKMNP